MSVTDYQEQISTFGSDDVWHYGCTCRRLSWVCFGMMIFFLLILQGMTFFVAISENYAEQRSLLFALIPIIGPLYCGVQLTLAGFNTSLILFLLFVPWVLTFLCTLRYRAVYKRILKAVNLMEPSSNVETKKTAAVQMPAALSLEEFSAELGSATLSSKQAEKPLDQPTSFRPSVPLQSVPTGSIKPTADAAPPVPDAQPLPFNKPAEPLPPKPDSALTAPKKPEQSAVLSLDTAEKEYKEALQDVLAFLNKNSL